MVPQAVSVWIIDLDQPLAVVDSLRAHLDEAEVLAAAARTDDTIRNRYVVAHGALREILAARLGATPEAVVISRQCARCGDPNHGKPEIPGSALSFSLSHSQSVAVVAVVTGARVGVDIEVLRPRARLDALARRVLSPEEHAVWLDHPPTARLRAFLERWTAKEAFLKATGTGIAVPLQDVPPEPEGWAVMRFASPPETVASIAIDAYATVHVESWIPPDVDTSRSPATDSSRSIDKFRSTAVGSVLAAGMLGLRDIFEPERDDKVAIVQDFTASPPFKDPIVLRLDPDHPEDSIVMVRPWLRNPPPKPPVEP